MYRYPLQYACVQDMFFVIAIRQVVPREEVLYLTFHLLQQIEGCPHIA